MSKVLENRETDRRKLLMAVAWNVVPVNNYEVSSLARTAGMPLSRAKALLDEMIKDGTLINVDCRDAYGFFRTAFAFPDAETQLTYLLKLKNNPKTLSLRTSYDNVVSCNGLENFQRSLIGMPIFFDSKLPIDNKLLDLLIPMSIMEEWQDFFYTLPKEYRFAAIDDLLYVKESNLHDINDELLRKVFIDEPRLSTDESIQNVHRYAFLKYILPMDFHGFETLPPISSPHYFANSAVVHHYRGDVDQAITLYEKALKMQRKKLFRNPVYSILYIWALYCAQWGSGGKAKLEKIFNDKKVQTSDEYEISRLFLAYFVNKESILSRIHRICNNRNGFPDNERLWFLFIIKHFHIDVEQNYNEDEFVSIFDRSKYRLYQLEFSVDWNGLQQTAEQLAEATGLTPLFPKIAKMEKWEVHLRELIDENAPKKTTVATVPASSDYRIVYHLDKFGHFHPKLQKGKAGNHWTRGRNISLHNFAGGMPEMNDMDRKVSEQVKEEYSNGWYGSKIYTLHGNMVFKTLAGYPLVFAAENPDMAIEITKEEPRITITRTREGRIKVESNILGGTASGDLVRVKVSNYSYRIIRISEKNVDLIVKLCKITDYPASAENLLMEFISILGKEVSVHSDLVGQDGDMEKIDADPTIVVLLKPVGDSIQAELFVKPFTDSPPFCMPGEGNTTVVGMYKEKKVQAVRNMEEEDRRLTRVVSWLAPLEANKDDNTFFFEDAYNSLHLLDILRDHLDEIRVEWPSEAKYKLKGSVDFGNISLSVGGVSKWFEVDGEVKIDNGVSLLVSDLIERVKNSKGRFVQLSDDEFIAISDKLRKQLLALDSMSTTSKGKMKLSPFSIGILEELEGMGAGLSKDEAFEELEGRIKDSSYKTYDIPSRLEAQLRPYQVDGYQWLSRLYDWNAGACLADDMGLGKTVQTIALMLANASKGPSLVVAPTSVAGNWLKEMNRFAPSLRPVLMNSVSDRAAIVEDSAEGDVVVTTYGLLATEALAEKKWNIIVLDEAHNIKNKETKMSKAAMGLDGKFRLLLTGTPLQNHLSEIWNLFQFATPGLLGTYASFTEKFINPIERNHDSRRQNHLNRLMKPFILRRTKNEVLDELPQKTEITLNVELSPEETAFYENLRQQAVMNLEEGGSGSAIQALAEITRLRQAACNPRLVYPEMPLESSKTAAFMKLVEELIAGKHRSLVFSQFTSHLALIREALDKAGIEYEYLDGTMTLTKREKIVKSFQTGSQPLFLISLKAGGTGLNLTSADYVIHLDPWWNPAIEDQASDRAHRIGQQRPVTVYRLIASGTIEEKIIRLHKTKKSLSDSLLDGTNLSHKLSKEEMLALLRECDA